MIRTVLIDDDPMELTALSRTLVDVGEVNIIRTYTNPAMLLTELDDIVPDAVFIDIEMGMANGLDVAEMLLSRQPGLHIVFVSSQHEYAFRAFEIGATDYILKPVTAGRIQKSIQRIHMRLSVEERVVQPTPPPALSVRTSGELQVAFNGTPVTFKTAKVKELFAFFIVHRQIPVHRDVLIESLWPDQPYKKAKIYLHTCLSHLRKALELADQSGTICFSGQHYTFDPKPLDLDLDIFKNAAESGDPEQMKKAVRLYGGRLLEREGYAWAEKRSEDLHRQMLHFLDRLISFYQDEDLERALEYLHLQQIHDPYLDRSVRNAMLILVQQGNRMEALRLYEQHVQMLDEDLGIDPDSKLTELYELLTG